MLLGCRGYWFVSIGDINKSWGGYPYFVLHGYWWIFEEIISMILDENLIVFE